MHYAIIAAGEGSRLAQEGVPVPKPLVRLDDRPMLKRLIDIFAAYKAESISVIANAKMPEVCEYLEALAQEMPILRVVVASTPSSMHSLREVTRDIPSGKVIATTVDTIFHPEDFYRYAEAFDAVTDADAFMGVTDYIDDEKPVCPNRRQAWNHGLLRHRPRRQIHIGRYLRPHEKGCGPACALHRKRNEPHAQLPARARRQRPARSGISIWKNYRRRPRIRHRKSPQIPQYKPIIPL